MIVRDWRDADPSDTQVLYAREQEYWVRELAWDASTAWREIEQARVTWGLPGFIAIDTDRTVRGWAYFLPEGETVHLGGVVADTRGGHEALIDACLESALRPPRPARVSCFLPIRAEGFEEILRERGFTCEHYRYLSRPIATGEDTTEAEPWNAGDLSAGRRPPSRVVWRRGQTLCPARHARGMGAVRAKPGGASRLRRDRTDRHARRSQRHDAAGLVLATRIAPGTLHLPQVAVHPARRREGLAQRLVEEACRAAAARGVKQATLLVADSNAGARALYEKMGFTDTSAFLAADAGGLAGESP